MKISKLVLICVFLGTNLQAQFPEGFSHQALIRDASKHLIINSPVGIRVSIIQGMPEGSIVYSETHTPVSNSNGLISFVIGQGTIINGIFGEINWINGPYFIKTEADPTGGTDYTISGTSQINSVPYALHSGSLVLTSANGYMYEIIVDDSGGLSAMALPGQPCPGFPNVTDFDGNIYNTVQIGNQCWMKENLKTTHYRNGIPLEYPGADNNAWFYNTTGAYSWYNNSIEWKFIYGALYNWYAVNNINGLCPEGWHVASVEERDVLINYLGGWNIAGGKMKSILTDPQPHPRWNSPNLGATNESNFSGLPSGFRSDYPGFATLGTMGWWWSSTALGDDMAYGYALQNNNSLASNAMNDKNYGWSVRCLKNP